MKIHLLTEFQGMPTTKCGVQPLAINKFRSGNNFTRKAERVTCPKCKPMTRGIGGENGAPKP